MASRAEVAAYLARIRPELHATPPALEVLRLLRGFGRSRRERVAVRVLTNASIDLLPDWARVELAVRRPWLVRAASDRPMARAGGPDQGLGLRTVPDPRRRQRTGHRPPSARTTTATATAPTTASAEPPETG